MLAYISDVQMEASGTYTSSPTLSSADSLEKDGLGSLTLLRRMAGKNLGLHKDPNMPDRPKWFAQGLGRGLVGYSERLYFMPKESHAKIRTRGLPLAKTNPVSLFFVDLLAVNPLVRGERRKQAIKFINLYVVQDRHGLPNAGNERQAIAVSSPG